MSTGKGMRVDHRNIGRVAASVSMFLAAAAAAAAAAAGCDRDRDDSARPGDNPPAAAAAGPAWFEDVTDGSGLRFVHDPGPLGSFFMPETVGSGAALFDYDNDGRLDVYLVQNAGPDSQSVNRLFHQDADGTFIDVTDGSGLGVAGRGMGVAVGDVDNDGLPDVLVTEYKAARLFHNRGGGKFREVTRQAGIDNPQWATSAAFFDYDRDGWLDLLVVNYIAYSENLRCADQAGKPEYCGPTAFPGTVSRLFRNLGAGGAGGTNPTRFEDVTGESGLGALPGPGLGVLCADFDADRWPDVLIANDAHPNHLWMNQHDGTFKEQAVLRGVAYNNLGQAQANMGIAVGDVDGNALADVYITHLTEESNILWTQGPAGAFQDRTAAAGLTAAAWRATGFGTALADFDHDGAPDLAVVNGRVRRSNVPGQQPAPVPSLGPHWSGYAERNQLFANDGSGKFRDVSAANPALCATPNVARGLAAGDVDNDGAVDLLVTAIAGPARLYRNVAPGRGHWLMVRAVDPKLGGRDAYGAAVTVRLAKRKLVGWINPGYGYACSNDPRAHFGLGDAARVESIDVVWPDGSEERFAGTAAAAAADRMVVLRKGEGG